MKECRKCKIQFEAGKFCKHCGTPLEDMIIPDPAVEVTAEPEPAVEKVVEPESEPVAEKVVTPEPEPVAEKVAEPESEPIAEKVATPEPEPELEQAIPEEFEKQGKPKKEEPVKQEKPVKQENPVKQEKPAKPKKQRGGFIFGLSFLSLLLLIVGFCAWYLGFSAIEDMDMGSKIKGDYIKEALLDGFKAKDLPKNEITVQISYGNLNELLEQKLNLSEISVPLSTIEEVYYHPGLKRAVMNLSNPIGRTSVLANPQLTVEEGKKIILSFEDIRLGKWELPIPSFLLSQDKMKWEFEFKDLPATLQELLFEEEGLAVKLAWDVDYLTKEISEIQSVVSPEKVQFVSSVSSVYFPAQQELLEFEAGGDFNPLLHQFMVNSSELKNWMILLPHDKVKSIISKLKSFGNSEWTKDLDKSLNESQEMESRRAQVEAEFQEHLVEIMKEKFRTDAEDIFDKLTQYHVREGVPEYVLNSRGKVYSQVLQKYIYLKDIAPEYLSQYELFAWGQNPVVGMTVGDKILITMPDMRDVEEYDKADFLQRIRYQKEEEAEPTPLPRGDRDRHDIAQAVKEKSLYVDDKIFIQYIVKSGDYAFMVCSSDLATAERHYFLLKRQDGKWVIWEQIDSAYWSLRDYFKYRVIEEMDFNVRLLPPYDISDFDVNYPGYSFSNEIIRLYDEEYEEYRKVQNRDVNFYSSYGGNTFMTFDANHKYLFTPNKIYIIRGNDSLKDFYTKMVPHPNYRNYYPIFTFYTD